jgi:hypothetical protein
VSAEGRPRQGGPRVALVGKHRLQHDTGRVARHSDAAPRRAAAPWCDPEHAAHVRRLVRFVVSSPRALSRVERIAEARRPRPGDWPGVAA